MGKDFWGWLHALDAKPGDKVVTNICEYICLGGQYFERIGPFVADDGPTRAAFWKRSHSNQLSAGSPDFCLGTPAEEDYYLAGQWNAAPKKSEVEQALDHYEGNPQRTAEWRKVLDAFKREVFAELKK